MSNMPGNVATAISCVSTSSPSLTSPHEPSKIHAVSIESAIAMYSINIMTTPAPTPPTSHRTARYRRHLACVSGSACAASPYCAIRHNSISVIRTAPTPTNAVTRPGNAVTVPMRTPSSVRSHLRTNDPALI